MQRRRGHRRRGALLGHRRGPARSLLRRPAGDLPQRARRGGACSSAMHEVFASLFNDRAISYRVHQGFDHSAVALSAGVQHMVRSDLGASGVMFTLDTDSGFRDVVFITASYGLGETVVQGAVNPDEFYVYKPALRAGKHADPAPQPRRQGHQDGVRAARAPASACARSKCRTPSGAASASTDEDIVALARQALHHRGALRPPDGHRVGQGRRRRARSTSCRRARRRCRAAPAARIQRYALQGALHACWPPAAASASASARARRASSRTRARWRACRRATCWSPT